MSGSERRGDSLYMVDVSRTFPPDVGHVGRVGDRLAAQQSILGHVEDGVLGGDDDDRRTCVTITECEKSVFRKKQETDVMLEGRWLNRVGRVPYGLNVRTFDSVDRQRGRDIECLYKSMCLSLLLSPSFPVSLQPSLSNTARKKAKIYIVFKSSGL